jgi:Bacteriophage Lambda NinG protein
MIKIKEKKCKGTGKAKGFGCGTMQLKRRYGLGISCCFGSWLYTSDEGKKIVNKTTDKVTEPRKSLEKAIKDNTKRKGITAQLLYTKDLVHQAIRLRDKFKPCISCGCQWNKDFQAGHFYNANNYRSIKFNFLNINGQCRQCNLLKDGNFTEYKFRLPERIGEEKFKILEELANLDKQSNKHWTTDELKLIQKEARKIINYYKK